MKPSLLADVDALPLVQAASLGDLPVVRNLLADSPEPARYRACLAAAKGPHSSVLRYLLPHVTADQRRALLFLATTENIPGSIDDLLDASVVDHRCLLSGNAIIAATRWCMRLASPHLDKLMPHYLSLGVSDKAWRENVDAAVGTDDVATVQRVLDAAGNRSSLIDRCVFRAAIDEKTAVLDRFLPFCNLKKVCETLMNRRQLPALDRLAPRLPPAICDHLVQFAAGKAEPSDLPVLHCQQQAYCLGKKTALSAAPRPRSRF